MSENESDRDALLLACDAMLREVAAVTLTPERLDDAAGVIRGVLAAIRTMDELDLGEVEPAVVFRVLP